LSETVNIEAVIKGYVNRGIRSVELTDEGHLVFILTDGEKKDVGKVTSAAPAVVFDENSIDAPSMKAVAEYVEGKLSIDSEVIL